MVYYGQRCSILLFLLKNKNLSGDRRSVGRRLPVFRYADSIKTTTGRVSSYGEALSVYMGF